LKPIFNLSQLVADVTTEFLAQNKGMRLEGMAEYALLIQGKMGEERLREAFEKGELSEEKMKAAITDLLMCAAGRARARGSTDITDEDVCLSVPERERLYPWG
jgi:hypothetical protein